MEGERETTSTSKPSSGMEDGTATEEAMRPSETTTKTAADIEEEKAKVEPAAAITEEAKPAIEEKKKGVAAMDAVCSSSTLDDFLSSNADLKVSYSVPASTSVNFVSENTTGFDVNAVQQPVVAGLGYKRKVKPNRPRYVNNT